MTSPRVCIIMLNWNGLTDTIECLESIRKIDYPHYRIVIVDNASSGNDVSVLRQKYGEYIHVIQNERNEGFPEGNNIGIRYALGRDADYVLLLNNDTVVDPHFLTALVNFAEAREKAGIVASKVLDYTRRDKIQSVGGYICWPLGIIEPNQNTQDTGQYDTVRKRDYVWATSMLIKRAVVEKVGFLDAFFFFGTEEYDYCTRAKRAGFEIYCVPQSRIWHKRGASASKLPQYPETRKAIIQNAGRGNWKHYYRLFRSYCPPVYFLFPFAMQMTLMGHLLGFIGRGDWDTIKAGVLKRVGIKISDR